MKNEQLKYESNKDTLMNQIINSNSEMETGNHLKNGLITVKWLKRVKSEIKSK